MGQLSRHRATSQRTHAMILLLGLSFTLLIVQGLISLYSSSKGLLQIVKSDSCFDFIHSHRQRIYLQKHLESSSFHTDTLRSLTFIMLQAPYTIITIRLAHFRNSTTNTCHSLFSETPSPTHDSKNLQSLIYRHHRPYISHGFGSKKETKRNN